MNTEQEVLERARACLKLGEMTGRLGNAPSNVYNVLSDLIDALARRDEQAEVVEPAAWIEKTSLAEFERYPHALTASVYRHQLDDTWVPLYRTPPAVAAGGVTAEGIVAALVATEFHRSQIQGFYAKDAGTHYIRDCTKPHDQQRIWSARSNEGSDYDLMHARMMERIELERWRIVLAALAVGDEGIRETLSEALRFISDIDNAHPVVRKLRAALKDTTHAE